MKNKFKALLAAFVGLFAFSVVAVGVNAETVTRTFVFDTADELPTINPNSSGEASTKSNESDSESLKLTIVNKFTAGTIKYDSGVYLKRNSTNADEYASFKFEALGPGSVIIKGFTTQSNSKYANLSLSTEAGVEIKSERVASKSNVDKSFDFTTDGVYVLKIGGDSTQSSNLKMSALEITYSYDPNLPTYDVDFYDGSTKLNTINVKENKCVVEPNAPTKEGYKFTGWYTDEACTATFDFATPITAATTLFAGWEVDTTKYYDVTLNVDGVTTVEKVAENSTLSVSSPTKVAYDFVGWSLVQNDANSIIDSSYIVTQDVTLYAIFKESDSTLYKFYDFNTTVDSSKTVKISDFITVMNVSKFGPDRTNTFDGIEFVNYIQASTIQFTLSKKAEVKIYATQTNTTDNVNNKTAYIKSNEGNMVATAFTPSMKPKTGTTVESYLTAVLEAGTYTFISPLGVLNIYGMKVDYLTESVLTNKTTAKLQWQYDNDSTPTKVRFIATLNDIEDLSKLTDVKINLSLIYNSGKAGYSGSMIVDTVYTSITNGETVLMPENTNTYYAICTLTDLSSITIDGAVTLEAKIVYTYDGVAYEMTVESSATVKSA